MLTTGHRGITGSGKTASAQLVINQVLRLSSHSKRESRVADQIKALSTLLDSFGKCIRTLPGQQWAVGRVYREVVQGMLNELSQNGYAKQVNSWLGRGENEPITAEDLNNVLHNQQVQQIAEKLGIPADQVLATLSKLLPQAVDQHSPDGQLQAPAGEQHQPS